MARLTTLTVKQVKVYKKKLKRHNDQVMSIYSPKGIEGGILVSGSADHEIRSKKFKDCKMGCTRLASCQEEDISQDQCAETR